MTTAAGRAATRRYRQTEQGKAKFTITKRKYHQTEGSKARVRQQAGVRIVAFQAFQNGLKDVPCMDCGGRFPAVAMDFDHVRGVKYKSVSLMWASSRQRVLDEIAKCEVVCSNCHRVRTHSRRAGK